MIEIKTESVGALLSVIMWVLLQADVLSVIKLMRRFLCEKSFVSWLQISISS